MLIYTKEQVQRIAEDLLGTQVNLRPIGNHELKRHLVYHVTNEAGLSVVFKLYYKKDRWNREVGVLKWLEGTQIKHPKLLNYGVLEDDTEWLIIEYLDGITLSQVRDQLSTTEQLHLIRQMGEELAKIHNLKRFDYFGNITEDGDVVNGKTDYVEHFIQSREASLEDLFTRDHPDADLYRVAGKQLKKNFDLLEEINQFHLCINDYGPRNLLVSNGPDGWQLKAVIDFEQSSVGNKERDLADLYYELSMEGTEFGEAFLHGYQQHSDISEGFLKRVDFYMLDSCLFSCPWAYEQAPDYYQKLINIMKNLISERLPGE